MSCIEVCPLTRSSPIATRKEVCTTKLKLLRLQTHGAPIGHGRIVKGSLLAAVSVSFICCLASAKAEAQQNMSGENAMLRPNNGLVEGSREWERCC
jgi:hypothetical protein